MGVSKPSEDAGNAGTNLIEEGIPVLASRALIVIDMQNFFVTGQLGTARAREIVPVIADKLRDYDGQVYVTQDINPFCAEDSEGYRLHPEIAGALPANTRYFKKHTFGCVELAKAVSGEYGDASSDGTQAEIEFCGVCTNVCVISNALMMKAFLPSAKITVDSACCAGLTPELHDAALEVMKSCRIEVK